MTQSSVLPQPTALDAQTEAARAVCWLLVINKPFYPVYVWWIAGHGFAPACLSALSGLAFAALLWLGRRDTLWLRAGFPIVGVVDTAFAAKLFGAGAGAEVFFAPCALLIALSLTTRERWWSIGLAALTALAAAGLTGRTGAPLYVWSEAELARLFSLNLISAAGLSFFILYRFSGAERR